MNGDTHLHEIDPDIPPAAEPVTLAEAKLICASTAMPKMR